MWRCMATSGSSVCRFGEHVLWHASVCTLIETSDNIIYQANLCQPQQSWCKAQGKHIDIRWVAGLWPHLNLGVHINSSDSTLLSICCLLWWFHDWGAMDWFVSWVKHPVAHLVVWGVQGALLKKKTIAVGRKEQHSGSLHNRLSLSSVDVPPFSCCRTDAESGWQNSVYLDWLAWDKSSKLPNSMRQGQTPVWSGPEKGFIQWACMCAQTRVCERV